MESQSVSGKGPMLADNWNKVLAELKKRIQTLQYSPKALRAYVSWRRRFRDFLLEGKRTAPASDQDTADFFTYLASEKRVAASTQNQAFNALLFLFSIYNHPVQLRFSKSSTERWPASS